MDKCHIQVGGVGEGRSLKVTSHLRGLSGSSEKKIRTHASFNKTLTICTSEGSLINGVYDKNIF